MAFSPSALAGVPAAAHGILVPEARSAPPSLGWQPVLLHDDRTYAAEREVEAPAQPTTTVRPKHVVRLRRTRELAGASFESRPRFPGASSFESGNLEPADVQLAVGPGTVVQLVNTLMTVWTTGGVRLKTMTLQALIGSEDRLVDPRVLFDASVGRFFVLATDVTANSYAIKIGVSQTSDPTGAWWFYTWDSPAVASACLDQPRLGYSSTIVAFSANVYDACNAPPFGPAYVGTELWALNKAQLVAGQKAQFVTWRPTGQLWSVEPAQSLTGSEVLYAAALEGAIFRVVTITGVPPAATTYTQTDLPIANLTDPRNAVQAGSADAIDTGTVRALDAVWSNGTLWTTSPDACTPPGDTTRVACARVLAASTSPMQVLDDRDLTLGPGSYVYYPAVRPDGHGNVVVVFGYSTAADFPSVGVTTKPVQGEWGSWKPVAAGTSAHSSGRWGDYFAAAVDPIVNGRVWVSGQVAGEVDGTRAGRGWGTIIGSVTPGPVQVPQVTYPAPRAQGVTQTAAKIYGAVDPQYDETSYRFEYGRALPYRLATPWSELPPPMQAQTVTASLTRLYANSTYHFRVVAKNAAGTAFGDDVTFKTKPKPKPKPKKKAKS